MTRRLEFTDAALADLERVALWLTQPGSGVRSRNLLARVLGSIRALQDHPCLWPTIEEEDVRELPCPGGYRALYLVDPDTGRNDTAGDVRVLRVFGPGQSRPRP